MKRRALRALTVLTLLAFFACTALHTSAAEKQYSFFPGTKNKPGSGKKVVLLSGDEEYRSEEMLTQLGKILAAHHGFDCTVLYAINPKTGEIDPTIVDNIPGTDQLEDADVCVMFLRFRHLPKEQMKPIENYLKKGKPLLGIRTSTHAFNIPGGEEYSRYSFNYRDPDGVWNDGFGRLVLGETWIAHHGEHGVQATRGVLEPKAKHAKITAGCEDVFGPSDVYAIRLPLPESWDVLLYGEVLQGMNASDAPVSGLKNDPKMPIAWMKPYRIPDGEPGKAFTTTMGCAEDFLSEGYRRLLINAVYSLAGLEQQIPPRTEAALIGPYDPLPMGFGKHKPGQKPE